MSKVLQPWMIVCVFAGLSAPAAVDFVQKALMKNAAHTAEIMKHTTLD